MDVAIQSTTRLEARSQSDHATSPAGGGASFGFDMKEEWRPIIHRADYEVSDKGRVRSTFGGKHKILATKLVNGYVAVGFNDPVTTKVVAKKVHHLVLESFVGPRPYLHDGMHLDGNKMNNKLSNLSWGTRKKNLRDSVVHGTTKTKLTPEKVLQVRLMHKRGLARKDIAKKFGVSSTCIGQVIRGETWSYV